MAIRKNRRMQKGGLWGFEWLENMFKPKGAGEAVGQGVGSPQVQSAVAAQVQGEGAPPAPSAVAAQVQGEGAPPAPSAGSQKGAFPGGKFRGGKSNRRNKSKKSRRTRRR